MSGQKSMDHLYAIGWAMTTAQKNCLILADVRGNYLSRAIASGTPVTSCGNAPNRLPPHLILPVSQWRALPSSQARGRRSSRYRLAKRRSARSDTDGFSARGSIEEVAPGRHPIQARAAVAAAGLAVDRWPVAGDVAQALDGASTNLVRGLTRNRATSGAPARGPCPI